LSVRVGGTAVHFVVPVRITHAQRRVRERSGGSSSASARGDPAASASRAWMEGGSCRSTCERQSGDRASSTSIIESPMSCDQ
jgi:hypothetical protein